MAPPTWTVLAPQLAAVVALFAGCPGSRTAGTPACPTDRTVVISSQEDVQRFAACTTASSLTIRTGATVSLAPLRSLETITGDLAIGPTVGMDEVALAELTEVGGAVRITSNGSLRAVFLPRLETAGHLEIEANASLTTISLPRLVTSRGSFVVTQNGSLELIDISVLATVGKDLVITDNPVLNMIEAGKLATVMDVRIEGNRKLPADQVEGIRAKSPAP